MDSNGFEQYQLNGMNQPVFSPNANIPLAAMTPQQAQLQYQQAVLGAAGSNAFYPPMNGFQSPAPGLSTEAFRNFRPVTAPGMAGSPMLQQGGFGQGMGPVINPPMYPYGMYMQQPQQQQVAAGQGRRGRVSNFSLSSLHLTKR